MSGRWYLDDGDADAAARDDADVVLDLGVELVETALDVNALRRVGADEDVAAAVLAVRLAARVGNVGAVRERRAVPVHVALHAAALQLVLFPRKKEHWNHYRTTTFVQPWCPLSTFGWKK